MAKYPGLIRDGRRHWTVRVRVPEKLQKAVGKAELWRSTGTGDHAEAKRKYPLIRAELDAFLLDAERRLRPSREVSDAELHQLVRAWFHRWNRKAADDFRPTEAGWERDEALAALAGDEVNVVAATVEDPSLQELATRFIREEGIAVELGSRQGWQTVKLMQMTHLELIRRDRARLNDTILEAHHDPFFAGVTALSPPPAPPAKALTFDTLLERWKAERKPPERTYYEWERAVDRLCAHVKHRDPWRVTKPDVVSWKAALIAAGKSEKTTANNIAAVRALYAWAQRNEHVTANPAVGVAPAKRAGSKAPRLPFTDDEAKLILSAARAQTGYRRWVPWILAYTGARLEEVAQALVSDVRQEDGVWVLDICLGVGKVLKNEGSARIVPLHAALIDEGFLKYVQDLKPSGVLFPDARPDRFGRRGGTATKVLGRWLRGLGVIDPRKVAGHSWRHRFKDLCRRAGVAKDIHDALTGHAASDMGSRYGLGFTVKTLANAIDMLPVQCAPGPELRPVPRAARRRQFHDKLSLPPGSEIAKTQRPA